MVSNAPSFAQKQASLGRRVLGPDKASYKVDEAGGGLRTVPLRNRRNGSVFWIKEEEVFYYTNPVAKPLVPGDRRPDAEPMFVRITPAEARIPVQPKTNARVAPAGLNVRPGNQARKRKRKRGRRG